MANQENSAVVRKNHRIHVIVHPYYLNNIKSGLSFGLNCKLKKYDSCLDGILLGYAKVQAFCDMGEFYGRNAEVMYPIQCDCYIFQPAVGIKLSGVVNVISPDHIGCLVHKFFNATIKRPEHEDHDVWNNRPINFGDTIQFIVRDLDYTGAIPYIEGELEPSAHVRMPLKSLKAKFDQECASSESGFEEYKQASKKSRKRESYAESDVISSTQLPSKTENISDSGLDFEFLSPIPHKKISPKVKKRTNFNERTESEEEQNSPKSGKESCSAREKASAVLSNIMTKKRVIVPIQEGKKTKNKREIKQKTTENVEEADLNVLPNKLMQDQLDLLNGNSSKIKYEPTTSPIKKITKKRRETSPEKAPKGKSMSKDDETEKKEVYLKHYVDVIESVASEGEKDYAFKQNSEIHSNFSIETEKSEPEKQDSSKLETMSNKTSMKSTIKKVTKRRRETSPEKAPKGKSMSKDDETEKKEVYLKRYVDVIESVVSERETDNELNQDFAIRGNCSIQTEKPESGKQDKIKLETMTNKSSKKSTIKKATKRRLETSPEKNDKSQADESEKKETYQERNCAIQAEKPEPEKQDISTKKPKRMTKKRTAMKTAELREDTSPPKKKLLIMEPPETSELKTSPEKKKADKLDTAPNTDTPSKNAVPSNSKPKISRKTITSTEEKEPDNPNDKFFYYMKKMQESLKESGDSALLQNMLSLSLQNTNK